MLRFYSANNESSVLVICVKEVTMMGLAGIVEETIKNEVVAKLT